MASVKPEENEELTAQLRDPATVRQAFSKVVRLYSEPLYWQIRRMVQNHDDANDILQNTFLKAWDNLENFRGEARLSTWLYKIAVNESLSFIERERRRTTLSLDDDEAAAARTATADSDLDGDELSQRLQQAIATLPDKQRLVFNMKYFDDMKYEEMSEILGTSVGALKASYHLATKKIEHFFDNAD
ncbi:MAG: sigma-70 family RNA polymerase sigma factor [Muribaculaceae bacterium]|nr:sigma-70 family RNA polymerase sigma factor [Muribaculaceae bacterium]